MEKQVQIYSVDTSDFYNDEELNIHNRLNPFYIRRSKLKKQKSKDSINDKELKKIDHQIKRINKVIKHLKNELYNHFQQNSAIRTLRLDHLNDRKIISIFDSALTRTLNMKQNNLSTEIFVVQTYFFDVLKDIILNGFIYNSERYVCFTASAGQIRTKKTVFIKESTLNKHRNSLMCGLSIEKINELGGVNINKYLAYLALCNSATDVWSNFNIDESIVVEDMETTLNCFVDFIDEKTFEIERKYMDIPINHTDGCGMMLPHVNQNSMMVRLPWVKGLMIPFQFDQFIKEQRKANPRVGKIKDIYGKEYDLVKDKISIVFTKSQFKMYKYYSSWDEYKKYFKLYNCQAAKCNEEEDYIDNAKINYQMLQTISDMTDKELRKLSEKTIFDIRNIGSDIQTMMRVLGVSNKKKGQNYYQRALQVYPELIQDTYSKEILKQVKKSLVKNARSGKLKVNGKYTFICPDMYAFAEYLFIGNKNPEGLLRNGQVSCNLYDNNIKLDCLRSPHLYMEHSLRHNVVNEVSKKWFITKGIYTSVHDPISKILMFDVDGDRALVCADEILVAAAERNTEGIVPLYYNMAVAGKERISKDSIFNGLSAAYTGGNIGVISNDITKVWNSGDINLDVIKWLCAINNFTIDYAKTLYKPSIPPEKKKEMAKYTKNKVPHFFVYAKDYKNKEVEELNCSVVNRLTSKKIIPNPRLLFSKLNLRKFDYRALMFDKDIEIDWNIVGTYEKLDSKKRFIFNPDEKDKDYVDNLAAFTLIRDKILAVNSDERFVADVLIKYLYSVKNSGYKTTLWSCFGNVIVENVMKNIADSIVTCISCGETLNRKSNRKKYCDSCWKKREKEIRAEINKKYYKRNKIKTV